MEPKRNIEKQRELEVRLKNYALKVLKLINNLPRNKGNNIYGLQLIRSSSSVGANYAEATCAHTKPDFLHAINISRKEARESVYWLELLQTSNPAYNNSISPILDEGQQIFRIFMSSVKTAKNNTCQIIN